MKKNYITEISLKDFLKLNLVGYVHERQELPDGTHQLVWKEHNLNEEVLKNMNWEENKNKTVVVAVHKNWEKAKQEITSWDDDFFYLDKWLCRFSGATTYIIGADISKLYKGKNKWYIVEDYFDIPYDQTETIYFIHGEKEN